jgi:DNA polymerase (family X)
LTSAGFAHVNDMTSLDASSVAALLREFGQRSALRGGNPFRAKAYARAADNLLALSLSLHQVIAQDRLREIPGVGYAIADIVKSYMPQGHTPRLKPCARKSRRASLKCLPFHVCGQTRSSNSTGSLA